MVEEEAMAAGTAVAPQSGVVDTVAGTVVASSSAAEDMGAGMPFGVAGTAADLRWAVESTSAGIRRIRVCVARMVRARGTSVER